MTQPLLVLGIGNPARQDDGVGPAVVHSAARRRDPRITVCPSPVEPTSLLEALAGARAAVVVDAVAPNGRPGAVYRWEAHRSALPADRFPASSTHGIGLPTVVELGRALGSLPALLIVYGVEAESFGPQHGLTPRVADAVEEVVGTILADADALRCGQSEA